jgi:hypothetical protein
MKITRCVFACLVCVCVTTICCTALAHGFDGYICQTSLGLLGGALALGGARRPTSQLLKRRSVPRNHEL